MHRLMPFKTTANAAHSALMQFDSGYFRYINEVQGDVFFVRALRIQEYHRVFRVAFSC